MKTAIFIPPLPRMSGGLGVLLQIARNLHSLGHDICIVQREELGVKWDVPEIPVHPWGSVPLGQDTVWLVPEGWPNALAPGLTEGARCVVYVQNWAFMLGVLPAGIRWDQIPVDFLSVSDPVRWVVREQTGRDSLVLRPAIDTQLFSLPGPLTEDDGAPLPPWEPVRVAWMPRKNKTFGQMVRQSVQERMGRLYPDITLEWVEIHNRTPDEVAELLRSSHIFLSLGMPEGLGLPPLEAMASGCLVVGFAGMGGFDYMRQAVPELPFALTPWWPLRPVSWGGNGFYVGDADVVGAAQALEAAALLLRKGGPELAALRRHCAATVAAYSNDAQKRALEYIWQSFMPQM